MSWPAALLLAILQGLTEFLPVSSSGHLVLLQNLLRHLAAGDLPDALAFDLLVHLGTLLAVLVYFRRDLARLSRSLWAPSALTPTSAPLHNGRRELALMALALVPTAVVGLALRSAVDILLHRPVVVAGLIGVTGLVLLFTRRFANPVLLRSPSPSRLTWIQALGMGAAQGLAVLPGLSRSGLTIATGMALGLAPLDAFRWSFLLSIPAIIGAALLEWSLHPEAVAGLGAAAFVSALVAAGVALGALAILSRMLVRARFHLFAWYCFGIAIAGALVFTVWLP
jgi:undecaprenyl-diphosphatase